MNYDPIWEPMDTLPEYQNTAWIYCSDGVQAAFRVDGRWYQLSSRLGLMPPVRWLPFLKPQPPKDIRL